jgi:YHS domain-containing protein
MTGKNRIFILLLAAFVTLAWLGFGQNSDTAKDPVCGMSVKKDGAKNTYEYKGTTYYFCMAGCKDAFAADPEKYLQAKPAETAKDPVCGMSVKKAEAKYTYDYKGTTYYFCSEGCKTEFSKNPEKYLTKDAAASMGGMHASMMAGKSGMAGCPFMSADVDKKIEATKDGAVITLTSKNAEMVKKIQDHAAMMKAGKCPMMEQKGGAAKTEAGCAGGCCAKK